MDKDCEVGSKDELNDLFTIENANSKNIEDYGTGEMPFVTSTNTNNGIEKYIDEDEEELIYRKPCITLSSFGQATVQINPFVARSHGAVLVLVPEYLLFSTKVPADFDKWDGKITYSGGKYIIEVPQDKIGNLKERKKVFVGEYRLERDGAKLNIYTPRDMSLRQLLYYAAQINLHQWRFSYGRWVTKKRLLKLEIQNITKMKLPSIQEIKKPFERGLKYVQNTF